MASFNYTHNLTAGDQTLLLSCFCSPPRSPPPNRQTVPIRTSHALISTLQWQSSSFLISALFFLGFLSIYICQHAADNTAQTSRLLITALKKYPIDLFLISALFFLGFLSTYICQHAADNTAQTSPLITALKKYPIDLFHGVKCVRRSTNLCILGITNVCFLRH